MSEERASYSTNITKKVLCFRCRTEFEPEDGYQSWSLCYDCGQSLYALVASGNEAKDTGGTQKAHARAITKKPRSPPRKPKTMRER